MQKLPMYKAIVNNISIGLKKFAEKYIKPAK